MSEEKLKPCPFCGGKALINEIPPHKHILVDLPDCEGECFIECTKCSCAISAGTKQKAISIWNRRADNGNLW